MPRHAATPNRKGREIGLLVGLGVAVVVIVGGVVAGVAVAIRTDVSEAPVAAVDVPAGATGEEVRDGDFAFVVTGVERTGADTSVVFDVPQGHRGGVH
ncbi:hypothetical protein ACGFK1_05310 [Mycobacterium sp. NPDC048908]|uniref:hypothetical protein n=1 Tax=Mycobacterium sp. NPDC048908 TaxID=3364292 RepID=UPI003716288A